MSKPIPGAMNEAVRLTTLGRLSEATALIQEFLGGSRSHASERSTETAGAAAIELTPAPVGVATVVGGSAKLRARARSAKSADAQELKWPAGSLRGLLKRAPPRRADVLPEVGRFVAESFNGEAGSLDYKLYVPGGQRAKPSALVVMLHGCTQTADDFAAGTRMNFLAEEQGAFVVYPEQAVSANAQRCWNWFSPRDQQRGRGEPALIAGIVREVMAEHRIDPRRVYIAGLSAGGAAAAVVAEAYPEIFAALGVHSGLACGAASDLPSAFAAMSGRSALIVSRKATPSAAARSLLPTIVFHGDRDTTVHASNGAAVIARADTSGELSISIEQGTAEGGHTYTRKIQRTADGQAVLEEWVLHGAGHAWSGGSRTGSFTDPKGPCASREMLRFFLEHASADH